MLRYKLHGTVLANVQVMKYVHLILGCLTKFLNLVFYRWSKCLSKDCELIITSECCVLLLNFALLTLQTLWSGGLCGDGHADCSWFAHWRHLPSSKLCHHSSAWIQIRQTNGKTYSILFLDYWSQWLCVSRGGRTDDHVTLQFERANEHSKAN